MSDKHHVDDKLSLNGFSVLRLGKAIKSMQLGTSRLGSESGDGLPLLKMGNLTIGGFDFAKLEYLSHEDSQHSAAYLLRHGDFLFNTRNTLDLVGKSAVWREQLPKALFNSNIMRIKFHDGCDTYFLGYYFATDIGWREFRRIATGTTSVAAIYSRDLVNCTITLPSLPQQRKIARILTTVDNLIEKTEALIAKYQAIKQGMMHDLFTRGVDEHGHLRPPYEEAPELYKQSELGWIPKEWEVCLLDEVAHRGSGHTPNKLIGAYWNGGIKWVSLADSDKLDRLFITNTDKNISELGLANSSAIRHRAGTVILSRDAGIGKSAIISEIMAVSQHFMAWFCGPRLINYFLYYWLQHEKPRFEAIAMGSTIKTIGLSFFKKLRIAVPPMPEQRIGSDAVLSVERRLFGLAEELAKYRVQKTGLMQDLLTGRVRVKVDEAEEVAAHA